MPCIYNCYYPVVFFLTSTTNLLFCEFVGINAKISYSIESGDLMGEFSIGPTDGIICTAKSLDRERQSTYTLQVMAKDQASPSSDRLNSTAEVCYTCS